MRTVFMREVVLIEVGCGRPELNEPVGLCTIASFMVDRNAVDKTGIKLFWQKIPSRRVAPNDLRSASIVGISAQINSLDHTRAIYSMIRQVRSDIPIVIGNLLAIYAGEELLREFPDAILCSGEGEVPFAEIHRLVDRSSDQVLDRQTLKSVQGRLVVESGELVKTGSALVHLSQVPPPRREFTKNLVSLGGIVRVEGSRGCHWGRCEFCSVASRFGLGGYRRFAPNRIIDDLTALAREGALSPYFSDEDFFGGRYAESRMLADTIIAAKLDEQIPEEMNFFVSVLASDVKHPDGRVARS